MGLFEQVELSYRWFNHIGVNGVVRFEDFYIANYIPSLRHKPDEWAIPLTYVRSNPTCGSTIGEFKQQARYKYGKVNKA